MKTQNSSKWIIGSSLVVTAILLLAGYVLLHLRSPVVSASYLESAKLSLTMTELRLSHIRKGENIHADFPVHNVGGRRLVIVAEDRNCCNDELNRVVIAPGHSAMVNIEINTDTMEENKPYRYRFSANDPDLPVFHLTLIIDFAPHAQINEIEPVPADNTPIPPQIVESAHRSIID